MPIYAYRCEACGFAKDVLQKVSDPQLTVCLSCGEARFKKQVTAAGFQLKGTGWYATDFRNGAGTTAPAVGAAAGEGNGEKAGAGNDGNDAGKSGNEKSANDKAGDNKAGSDKNTAASPASTPAACGNNTTAAPAGSNSSSAG